MATVPMSDARANLPSMMRQAAVETVFIERRGQVVGVLVSPERYDELMRALDDSEDVAAFDEAMAEEGPNVPWDQVKSDLGWS